MSDELPKGWATARISDLAITKSGGTPSTAKREYWDNGDVPWINSGALKDTPISAPSTLITELGLQNSSARLFPRKTVVIALTGATTGRVGLLEIETSTNQSVTGIFPSPVFVPEYIFFYLRAARQAVLEQAIGSAQPHINKRIVDEIEVPLAPLPEQRRIVAKLEALLAKVDACQQRLAKIPLLLKRFRQSVLAAACSGKLTADWREENPDVQPAADLFAELTAERQRCYEAECKKATAADKRKPKNPNLNERSRNLVGDLPEVPKTWAYFRLEDLCHLITDGTHKTPKYQSAGVPFLSVKNVRPFLVRDADIKFISEEEHQQINARCNPQKGDILYTKVGATFGYAAVVQLDYRFSIFVSLALLKPVTPQFSSAFAELVMNSEVVFSQARERISGIGTPDLHLVEIRDFRAPLPPLPEQHEIVRRVESLFALADQIEARFTKAQQQVDKLTPSLLAKAFRGDLVPQDPNDEPASKLLERIRAANPKPESSRRAIGTA